MDGLVGYGSSSDNDSDSEQPEVTNNKPATNVPSPPKNDSLFPHNTVGDDYGGKHLDISDDEESYAPVSKPTPKTNGDTVLPPPAAITPPVVNQKLTKLIDEAQIVSVSADNLKTDQGVISNLLPKPKQNSVHELELEHLHKSKRRKEDKRKIFAFDLNDYLEDEEDGAAEKEKPKRQAVPKSTSGLFSILPQPKNCKIGSKSTKSVITNKSMLMPRIVKKNEDKKAKHVDKESEETEEIGGIDFFAFGKSENDTKEIAMAAKSVKLEAFKPKPLSAPVDLYKVKEEKLRSIDSITTPLETPDVMENPTDPNEDGLSSIPPGFRDFAFNNSEIIDVNQEIQSTEEWAVKNLDYSDETPASSGKCPLKGQAKRKNQINYLAWQAKERESELKNQWASNRVNRHATQSKYGFR